MNDYIARADMQAVLARKVLVPSITLWNRLEGRPRTANFDRALKAEVRDALFMLTKQWQMGEFRGDDAGSPIFAKVHMETTRLQKYRPSDHPPEPFETGVPLEAKVERRPVPLALDIRLAMGRHWLKLLAAAGLQALKPAFLEAFPITAPDPDDRADAQVAAHRASWQAYAAAAGRAMDGGALQGHLAADPANRPYDTLQLPQPLTQAQRDTLDGLGERFMAWFARLFYQPSEADAWLPERLEYRFACAAPTGGTEKVLEAEEYYHGHLDWYNFSVAPGGTTLGDVLGAPGGPEDTATATFFPVPVQFDGMPNTRWWTFEEGRTNFGDIAPDTTDLGKLMLMEFGLIYANDWFLVPFTLPAGTVANVRGMAVTNVFGERTWIEPAGAGQNDDWQRWSMFTLDTAGGGAADPSLLLLPTNPKIQKGAPVESVSLIRDEMANMVWGIETRIPLPSGGGKPGREAALELRRHIERIAAAAAAAPTVPAIANDAQIRYRLMTSVPENWIPFIPVHLPGDIRQIQFQRASMPRLIEDDTEAPQKIAPRTGLLRHGLDAGRPYFLFEEEAPRAGVQVSQSFQRTRWHTGRAFVWFGARKTTGRGEGSSGLAFDQIVPMKPTVS